MAEAMSSEGEEKLVKTLPAGALGKLSTLLRPRVPGKDWKELAGHMGFTVEEIRYFDEEKDPVVQVLTKWSLLKHEHATTNKLVDFLRKMGRLDVIQDIQTYIDQALTLEQYRAKQLVNENYDVFISYAKADKEFAKEILETLENRFHLTVCIDYRDFLPGVNELEQIAEVIEKRCRKVIVIYSQDYFNCKNCDYQAKIALSFSPGCKTRNFIPVLYKNCEIPTIFNGIFFLNYTDEDCRQNFWENLSVSIKRK